MSNVILDPVEINSGEIDNDSSLKYFLSTDSALKDQKLVFNVKENANLDFVMVDFSKHDINLTIDVNLDAGAKAQLYLASLNSDSFSKRFIFNVTHKDRDTYSRTIMSGINNSNSLLSFKGNSKIINGAHNSDTRQEGRITNLSSDAKSETSPSLLIDENDVKASHGAALGAYNIDQLFYLMSRGLKESEAKKLITFGTLLPIILKLDDEELIEKAKNQLERIKL